MKKKYTLLGLFLALVQSMNAQIGVNNVTNVSGLRVYGRGISDSGVRMDMLGTTPYNVIRAYEGEVNVSMIHFFGHKWYGGDINKSAGAINLQSAKGVTIGQWDSPSVYFKENGNVGIGTTNPQAKLDVKGVTNVSGLRVYGRGISDSGVRMDMLGTTPYNVIRAYEGEVNVSMIHFFGHKWYGGDINKSAGAINLQSAKGVTIGQWDSPSVYFKENGNVGIGTTNPTAKLEINSEVANTSGLKFTNLTSTSPANPSAMPIGVDNQGNVVVINGDGANVSWNITGNSGTNSNTHFLGTLDAQDLIIKTSNQERLRITKDGVVGIGGFTTSLPTVIDENNPFRLYVKNGIRTERLKVDISADNKWADFVFEENYKLRSLDELETYIGKNKHLPNIPNAKDVLKNGLDIAEINARLLEKVEELTLYTIDLNKKNQKQEELILSLSERLDKLENQTKNNLFF